MVGVVADETGADPVAGYIRGVRTLLPALTSLLTLAAVVVALVLSTVPRLPEGGTPIVTVAPGELE